MCNINHKLQTVLTIWENAAHMDSFKNEKIDIVPLFQQLSSMTGNFLWLKALYTFSQNAK